MDADRALPQCIESSASRMGLWAAFATRAGTRDVAEIGVYRGDFAARLLHDCDGISTYYMIEPWRHLDDWNKPANKPNDVTPRLERRLPGRSRSGARAGRPTT
jgi:hypothetical protein